MELSKVRKGLHIRVELPITRLGLPEDFTDAENISLVFKSEKYSNVNIVVPTSHYSITGNVVTCIITDVQQAKLPLGNYEVTLLYQKPNDDSPTQVEPFILDKKVFELVDKTYQMSTPDPSVQVITIDGEVSIPREGIGYFAIWKAKYGTGESTVDDMISWHASPALEAAERVDEAISSAGDAATLANQKAVLANEAATLANEKALLANSAAEAASQAGLSAGEAASLAFTAKQLADEATFAANNAKDLALHATESANLAKSEAIAAALLAGEKAGLANTAAQNADDKAALANTAAGNASNAATSATNAATAANTAATQASTAKDNANNAAISANAAAISANAAANAQNAYNVTVAVPLAAGVYYNSSSARLAVPVVSRKRGLVLTYETAAGTWYAERFRGTDLATWTTVANWEQVPDATQLTLKADLLNGTVPAEQLPSDLIRTTLYLTQVGHRKRRIQDASAVEDGTMLWTIVSGTEYLASLPDALGLGLYLVSQDLSVYKKLSKTNSTLYADGTPAMLDGTEGDIQMCWRKPIYVKYYEKQESDGLYEHIEISHLNILGECEMIAPGGGFPAVLNRTTGDLRALYSTDPNYRGGNNANTYDSDPVKTLIGKPATNLSAYSGEVAAKKRGQLWTTGGTPFFATLAILQIMLFGTNDSQGAIVTDDVLVDGEGFQSCKKDVNKLFSGGFGVSNGFPSWATYNANNPTFDLSAGFTRGDITGKKVYKIKDWPTVGTNQTLSIAYFFGMPYPFNHYWHGDAHQRVDQQTEAQGFKTVVYQKRDITTVPISGGPSLNGVVPPAPWEKVAEASRTEGNIRRTSFNALCLIPTVAGSPGASNKFYPDYFYNNGATSFGWRAPIRFASLDYGAYAGAFHVNVYSAPANAAASYGAFCCHFSAGIVPKKLPG